MRITIGNVKSKAVANGRIMAELQDYLKVKVSGAFFSEAYKKRRWDGYKRFITPSGYFATGFLPLVVSFIEGLGEHIEIIDERPKLPELKKELCNMIGVIDGEEWLATGKYSYQLEYLPKVSNHIKVGGNSLYFPRGVLNFATNAGKTSVVALIVNNLKKEYRCLFVVANKLIYKQAVEFFSKVVGYPVGEVKSGKEVFKNFTVAMVKTLYRRARDSNNTRAMLHNMEVLFVDESDESGAKDYSKVLQFIGAGMRIFVSGTALDGDKVNSMIQIGLSGPILAKITNAELIEKGVSQRPIISIILNNERKPLLSYTEEKEAFISKSESRAASITTIIERHKKGVLVSFTNIEHGEYLLEYIQAHSNLSVALVHGTSKHRDRDIALFKKGDIAVLLASTILKRGANIPNIRVLVYAGGGKSKVTLKQFIGRAIRLDGLHTEVCIYDFYDTGRYLLPHSKKRIAQYKKEGFEIKYTYENKNGKPLGIW